ncbi:MAG: DUF4184 family protein, partial [Bacteroidota bacterium]
FTAAHPSIFIPLYRVRWISATGLICGSMSPDFENFIRMSTHDVPGHTVAGIFFFDLPVSLLMAVVFHHLLRDPLTANLPGFFRRRLQGRWTIDFIEILKHRWPMVIFSCLLGAASHIGWDNLTHNGWAAQHLEFYRSWSVRIGDLDYPPFYVLQQISTVLGMAALLYYLLMLTPQPQEKSLNASWWFWPGVLVVMLTMMAFMVELDTFNYDRDFGNVIVTGVSSFLTGLMIMASVTRKRTYRTV